MKKFISITVILAFSLLYLADAQKPGKIFSSDLLTEWMNLHCRVVRNAKGIAHVAYSRHFSYTAIAAYESIVHSDPSYRSLAGQINGLEALPSPAGNLYWPAALNAAYAEMLRKFYSSFDGCVVTIDSMEKAQEEVFRAAKVNEAVIAKSEEYGKEVAAQITRFADGDGSNSPKEYKPLTGEGMWKPASKPAAPFWSENRTLTKNLVTAYDLKQPVYSADSNSAFYKMADEVYNVSVNLTPEQRATALYWDDSPNGKYMTVYGHWTSILAGIISQRHLTLIKAAEAYAKMTIAMHEASILAWRGKYEFNVLRPVTYIQEHINKNWTPLIATPPHPEFPAAHATLSNAAAVSLCSLFGEHCKTTDDSYIDIGMNQRTYPTLRDVAREAGISRLYGGIHYRYSIEKGFALGEATAKFVDHSLQFHSKR